MKLDSASTMWVPPVPDRIWPGDIAVKDFEESPLVTAFVKTEPGGEGSEIRLTLFANDQDWEPDASWLFSADVGDVETFCKYPAVEVTYSRQSDENYGVINVHVVWSQLTENDNDEGWDLFYVRYHTGVDYGEIDWESWVADEIEVISPTVTDDAEIQPDLAIVPMTGDLLVAFNRDDWEYVEVTPNTWQWVKVGSDILAVQAEFDGFNHPDWYDEMQLSDSEDHEAFKAAPSVDSGLMDEIGYPHGKPKPKAAAAWSQLVLDNEDVGWVIMYCEWDPSTQSLPSVIYQVTEFNAGRHNGLPKVDIPSPSCFTPGHSNLQAVLTWVMASWSIQEGYTNPSCRWVVTPDLYETGNNHQSFGSHGLAPDLACYQMNDAETDEQWLGISYYEADSSAPPWTLTTWTRSFSYTVSRETGNVTYDDKYDYPVYESEGSYWDILTPFTGSTLCLRDPSAPFIQNEIFGLGWIQEEDPYRIAYVSEGTIHY